MKALLDHVSLDQSDLQALVQACRDQLGIEVERAERAASDWVTVTTGTPGRPPARRPAPFGRLRLLVDDFDAALALLRGRGLQIEAGAGGVGVATFALPEGLGLGVEIAERPRASVLASQALRNQRYRVGDLEIATLSDGLFRLDGGAMFGVVSKVLWASKMAADDRNRVVLAMRPLLVRGERTMLIDAGVGDKENEKFADIYGLERARALDASLAEAGLGPDDIEIVLATHLHFDHAGGFTMRDRSGRVRPRFPRARYVVRAGEWDDATHPHARNRGSYFADNFVPLADAGVLDLLSTDQPVMPGVSVRRTGGHTRDHQMVVIESAGAVAFFVADLIPTTVHLPDAWIMGFDLYPLDTLKMKQDVLGEAVARQALVLFEHDPLVAAGYILEADRQRTVRPAE